MGKIKRCALSKKRVIVFLLFLSLVFIASVVGAEAAEDSVAMIQAGQGAGDGKNAPQNERVTLRNEEDSGGKMTSVFPEVAVSLSDRLKAFLSFGAPSVRDLKGRSVQQNYRAVVGFNIEF